MSEESFSSECISDSFRLIQPGHEDFKIYGGEDVVARASAWASLHKYFLYRGPGEHCVHAFYRMHCYGAISACNNSGMDHTNIWVPSEKGERPFILTHPYVQEIPEKLKSYGYAHGLVVSTNNYKWSDRFPYQDSWYASGAALPVKLSLPQSWPLFPLEADVAALLSAMPPRWPEMKEQDDDTFAEPVPRVG